MCRRRGWIGSCRGTLGVGNNPLSITQPGPSRRRYLFTSLATAGLGEDSLPLDVGLVVSMDRGRQVESVLQDLAGAGVDHGPLNSSVSKGCPLPF